MKTLFLLTIRFYQKILSPDTGLIKKIIPLPRACRFSPSCSQYTFEAVSRYGIIKGLILGGRRILRCHPWSPGGFEPVPDAWNKKSRHQT